MGKARIIGTEREEKPSEKEVSIILGERAVIGTHGVGKVKIGITTMEMVRIMGGITLGM